MNGHRDPTATWLRLANRFLRPDRAKGIREAAFSGTSIRQDIEERIGFRGDIVDIYVTETPRLIHKWHHYLPIYDRYFSSWRNRPVRFLEIGVSQGGSLGFWRQYFGPDAIIFGIDVDPACAAFDGIDGQVRIGSQDDPDFLRSVIAEMGGVDVVLDDGSHVMAHIRKSLDTLFPLVSEGGTYMIEDLHTAYWKPYGGGYKRPDNFFNTVRHLIDDLHIWYHGRAQHHEAISRHCSGIHVHDSICVLDRSARLAPVRSMVGGPPVNP